MRGSRLLLCNLNPERHFVCRESLCGKKKAFARGVADAELQGCSRPLSTWIQIPKTVRRSCRTSLSSIIPAGNGGVLIRGLTSLGAGYRFALDVPGRREAAGGHCLAVFNLFCAGRMVASYGTRSLTNLHFR